jgi:ribosomal protein S18 acetylase RimI-like enzyme
MLTTTSPISCSFRENTALGCLPADFWVGFAHLEQLAGVKILADANRNIFGFVTRGAFNDAIQSRSLIVATRGEQIVGFLRYHHRKQDLQTTLYDICVAEPERGKNLGRLMLTLLIEDCRSFNRTVISLKCPSHLKANIFYEKNGFRCIGSIAGKRQELNVWRLDLIPRGEQ